MAKYNKSSQPLRQAKAFIGIEENALRSIKNSEKTARKTQANNTLFYEGYRLGMSGKDITEATGVVVSDGIQVKKCEHRVFKHGYDEGFNIYVRRLGHKLGFENYTIDELPIEYINYEQFLIGYKHGIEDRANADTKAKSR